MEVFLVLRWTTRSWQLRPEVKRRHPHDDIDITYGLLGSYVTDHALAVTGPLRESYLVGPRDSGDASTWRTEIAWPVFRTAAAAERPGT